MSAPVFAVVGHVNRGKSSIVSTLAADDSVRIDAEPGTTRQNRSYPLRVAGETLYTLVDTPGFERARHVLAWLREHETTTADRRKIVERFAQAHAASGQFPQECELLRPILEGAAILYVVDGSLPFSPASEAETEILRWTGQPRMALINPIGAGDHGSEWRRVLDQYFSLVRTFNAQQADLCARLELLRGLRELVEDWRGALDRAIALLLGDREASLRESAGRIADALVELATAREEQRLGPDDDLEPHREPLAKRFLDRLRQREQRLRGDLRRVYLHEQLQVLQEGIDRVDEDLFATSTWNRLGLSLAQLAASGAAAGALIGGGIDVAVGGTSLLVGSAVGGLLGLASTLWAWNRLFEVRVLGAPLGGQLLRIGPLRNPNFGWVVLDRALIFHAAVARHAHARRQPIDLGGEAGRVRELAAPLRQRIARCLDALRRQPDASDLEPIRAELAAAIEAILREDEPALRDPATSGAPRPRPAQSHPPGRATESLE